MNKYWMTEIVANWGKFFTLIRDCSYWVFSFPSVTLFQNLVSCLLSDGFTVSKTIDLERSAQAASHTNGAKKS